jgi:hypothetical protein
VLGVAGRRALVLGALLIASVPLTARVTGLRGDEPLAARRGAPASIPRELPQQNLEVPRPATVAFDVQSPDDDALLAELAEQLMSRDFAEGCSTSTRFACGDN